MSETSVAGDMRKGEGYRRRGLRIAFVSRPDARRVTAYSGIPFHIVAALEKAGHEITLISPLSFTASFWLKLKHYLYRKLTRKRFLRDMDPSALRQFGRVVSAEIARIGPDLVFSIDTLPFRFAALPEHLPLVIWGEASFHSCENFFPTLTGLAPESGRNADLVDRVAFRRANCVIFPSNWAAQDAIRHYGLSPQAVRVVPYGANVDATLADSDLPDLFRVRSRGPLRLLFVGADWGRKGGNKAVAVVRELNQRGIPTELHIVGCRWIDPAVRPLEHYFIDHGFIDKSTASGQEQLARLYRDSKFFFMLSSAETFGIVYAEAGAYALPSLANRVGGVAEAVSDNVSASLFAPDAAIGEICDRIVHLTASESEYQAMCRAAVALFRQRFDWVVVSQQLDDILHSLVASRTSTETCEEH